MPADRKGASERATEPRLIRLLRETTVRYFVAQAIRAEAKRVRGNEVGVLA